MRSRRRLTLALTLSLAAFSALSAGALAAPRLGTDTEAAPQRVALLIGNSKYQNVPSLKNPPNDVAQMESSLKRLGFKTTVALDLDHDGFVDALASFANHIEAGRDSAVPISPVMESRAAGRTIFSP